MRHFHELSAPGARAKSNGSRIGRLKECVFSSRAFSRLRVAVTGLTSVAHFSLFCLGKRSASDLTEFASHSMSEVKHKRGRTRPIVCSEVLFVRSPVLKECLLRLDVCFAAVQYPTAASQLHFEFRRVFCTLINLVSIFKILEILAQDITELLFLSENLS